MVYNKEQINSKLIKVASIVPYKVIPAQTGGQKAIFYFLQYFSKHCDVTCYTIRNNEARGNENFRIKNIIGNGKLRYINPIYFFTLRKEIKKEKITHLLIDHPYYGWLGFLLKKFASVQLIVRSHNIESMRFRTLGKWWWGVLWWYERFTHRVADVNLFITEEDKKYAIEKFGLESSKCTVITYGTEKKSSPSQDEKAIAKKEICSLHQIVLSDVLLLYNGALDYLPNLKALDFIIDTLAPALKKNAAFPYTIIICGGGLPEKYNSLRQHTGEKIIYAGFVDNIEKYFIAADIFLNPITDGGGIKTKLVEALAANTSAVSFRNGAIGIPKTITGRKLAIVPDNDLAEFELQLDKAISTFHEDIPTEFLQHFYWDNIAVKAVSFLQNKEV